MMYVRKKRVRNTEYYYLVRSKRVNGVPHQFVVKYLGRQRPSVPKLKKIIKECEKEEL